MLEKKLRKDENPTYQPWTTFSWNVPISKDNSKIKNGECLEKMPPFGVKTFNHTSLEML